MKNQLLFLLFPLIAIGQDAPTVFDAKLDAFPNVRDFTLSPEGDEAFFTIQSPTDGISQIVSVEKNSTGWSEANLLPFCDEFQYLEPFLTHDSKRLYFVSDRPIQKGGVKKDMDIWYVERTSKRSAWSVPVNLGAPVNSDLNEFFPSVAAGGNIYLTIESPKGIGKDDIFSCKWNGSSYESPVLLNQNVNSSGYEFNAFVSPEEDFLIFTKYNEKDGYGSGNLYISRKDDAGNWLPATNLGEGINTKFMEYCPFYDRKTQTLYFTSRRSNLASRKFKDAKELQRYVSTGQNGLSKIYKVKFAVE